MRNIRQRNNSILFIPLFFILFIFSCSAKPNAQSYIDQGFRCITESNYEEAIIAFSNAIEIDDKNGEAYKGRTIAYLETAQFENAYKDYLTASDVITSDSKEEIKQSFKEKIELTYQDENERYQWYIDHPGIIDEAELTPPEVIDVNNIPDSLMDFLNSYSDAILFIGTLDEDHYRYNDPLYGSTDLLEEILYLSHYGKLNLSYEEFPMRGNEDFFSGIISASEFQAYFGSQGVLFEKYNGNDVMNVLKNTLNCSDEYVLLTQSEPRNCDSPANNYGYFYKNGNYYFYLTVGNYGVMTNVLTIHSIEEENPLYRIEYSINYLSVYENQNYNMDVNALLKKSGEQWSFVTFETGDYYME